MVNLSSPLEIAGTGWNARSTAGSGGRVVIPVAPANYIYSHFKHVSGSPAPEGVHGAAVSKLKILDTIIERLTQAQKQRALKGEKPDWGEENAAFVGKTGDAAPEMSEQELDAKIIQLKQELESAAQSTFYAQSAALDSGSFFSIAA